MNPLPTAAWNSELWWRMRTLFPLKLAGTSAWIWVFFVGYFQLLRHPAHPVTQMPLTALDRLIPFQPSMLYPYLSLWLYVGIAPGLMPGFRALCVYGLWAAALSLAGLGFFYAWPTGVPPLSVAIPDLPGFRLLQGVDSTGNACPSMHVAFAMFSALWLEHIFKRVGAPWVFRVINVTWLFAITWSTLAIRQHVVLDAVAGASLGTVFALASLHWQPRVPGARGRTGAAIIDRMPADIAP